MMTLEAVADSFNKVEFRDTYGVATFSGQLMPYPDSTRSGPSTRRRILDTADEVSAPARQTVTEMNTGQIFIMAYPSHDYVAEKAIRNKFPVIPIDNQYTVRSIEQTLTGSGGTTDAYLAPTYVKRFIYEETSQYVGGFEVYMPRSLTVNAGDILHGDGRYFIAKHDSWTDDIGFGFVEATELQDPVSTADVVNYSGELNPSTREYTSNTIAGVDIFSTRGMLDFEHENFGYVELKEGDRTISFLKSAVATLRPGDLVDNYKILAISDEGNFWKTHCRN